MRPEELVRVLTSLTAAADLVEAIKEPNLCGPKGWDLEGWTYELIPWGVRFTHWNGYGVVEDEVEAISRPDEWLPGENGVNHSSRPKTVVMFR